LSSQRQPHANVRTESPLVREGQQLLPNLTHVVDRSQPMYVYYEVYDPAPGADGAPHLRTSLAFYRDGVKMFETPVVERTALDDTGWKAAIFTFELVPASMPAGFYTCQVNVIDTVGGTFAFPRVALLVR
jgi:hypothetical protein